MSDPYVPTLKLRWLVGVDYHETGYDTFTKETRKLQQWWAPFVYTQGVHLPEDEGEWRDVPEADDR